MSGSILSVTSRTYLARLDQRVNLAINKLSVAIDASDEQWSIANSTSRAHTYCSEVAKAIGNKVIVVSIARGT